MPQTHKHVRVRNQHGWLLKRNEKAIMVPDMNQQQMACKAVRRHYRLYLPEPAGDVYADMLSYINPVRPGRKDKRRLRYKPAVWFLYRVA